MKIAVIGVREIPADRGEIERYCQEFYPRIAARGHQVDLFVQPEPNRHPWFSVGYYHNVRIIALASLPRKHISFFLNSALSTIWASLGNYDVIHIQGTKAAWFAWFPQLFSGSKIVVTTHKLDLTRSKLQKTFRWLLPWIERTAVKNADEIVVTSKPLGEYFQCKYNIRPRYIPNAPGIDRPTDSFNYGKTLGLKTKRYILCLGSLSPENRPDLAIQAFQKLQNPDWKLVIAGEIGDSLKYAIELLSLAKQNRDIIFTNEIREENLAEIITNAGLLVVPGNGSDLRLPVPVLKAMQQRVPVLASDNPINQELIGRDRGLLFESGKVDSLLQKLQYALSEPTVLTNIAQLAQNYVAINHNWDRVTYGNLSLYLKMTASIYSQSISHNL